MGSSRVRVDDLRIATATAAAGAAGISGWFVLSTVLMDQVPDVVLVAVPLIVAAVILLAGGWRHVVASFRSSWRETALVALGGVAAWWAAPLLVLTQRASDAPSGSEVLFFVSAGWAVVLSTVGLVFRIDGRRSWVGLAITLAGAAGAAGILANWERPSSFSPLGKFPVQEFWMLVAGAVFAVGLLVVKKYAVSLGPKAGPVVSVTAAVLASLAAAVTSLPSAFPALERQPTEFVLLGVCGLGIVWGFTRVAERSYGAAGALLIAPPALITALSVLERATATYGPTPIVWRGALPALALCLTAAVCLWIAETASEGGAVARVDAPGPLRGTLALSILALAASMVGLFLPSLSAHAIGAFGEPFEARWLMPGAESAAAWIALAAAACSLAAAVALAWKSPRAVVVSALVTALSACISYPFLADTPVRTWQPWIPSEVQNTYGTEYARFSAESVVSPASIAAVMLAGVAALILVAIIVRTSRAASEVE